MYTYFFSSMKSTLNEGAFEGKLQLCVTGIFPSNWINYFTNAQLCMQFVHRSKRKFICFTLQFIWMKLIIWS